MERPKTKIRTETIRFGDKMRPANAVSTGIAFIGSFAYSAVGLSRMLQLRDFDAMWFCCGAPSATIGNSLFRAQPHAPESCAHIDRRISICEHLVVRGQQSQSLAPCLND